MLLIWLYFLAIAVLIGAALNAAMRELWPVEERLSSRAPPGRLAAREVVRRREAGHERPLTPMPDGDVRAGAHDLPRAAADAGPTERPTRPRTAGLDDRRGVSPPRGRGRSASWSRRTRAAARDASLDSAPGRSANV